MIEIATGKITAVRIDPNSKPHPKASAIGTTNSSNPPIPYAVGSKPATVVAVVRKIGRKRIPAASMMLCFFATPFARN